MTENTVWKSILEEIKLAWVFRFDENLGDFILKRKKKENQT